MPTGRHALNMQFNHIAYCARKAENLYHIMLYRVYLAMSGIRTHNLNGDRY